MIDKNNQKEQIEGVKESKNISKKTVPAGVGIFFGICLGAGVSLTLSNLTLGIAVGLVFAIALEIAFKHGREKGDA